MRVTNRAAQLGRRFAVAVTLAALAGCSADDEGPAAPDSGTVIAASDTLPEKLPPGDYTPRDARKFDVDDDDAERVRADALSRAQAWSEPAHPVEHADFATNSAAFYGRTRLACKFIVEEPGGTTQKFDCVLPGGEVVKVKYGGGPEVSAEIAAARLATALGFAADDMHSIERLRCFGCPEFPFQTLKMVYATRTADIFEKRIDYDKYQDFEWVAVERRFRGLTIETSTREGWAWWELEKVDSKRGGAPPHHVDALRLLAVFLAHWDNKDENQRLVCLPGGQMKDGCAKPFLVLHDLGGTFGPRKLNLTEWRDAAIWDGPAGCTATMRNLPTKGATFGSVQIGEAGRRFLAERLARMSDRQIRDLFETARVPQRATSADGKTVDEWVAVFKQKVRQISERRCGVETT